MREIKFRAWDKFEKKMWTDFKAYLLIDITNGEYIFNTVEDEYQIDRYILMQFTGLLDKNGKEIYEGDIVSPINFNGSYRQAIVKFKNGCFIVESTGMCKDYECLGDKIHFEAIGNIYEYKHLLE